ALSLDHLAEYDGGGRTVDVRARDRPGGRSSLDEDGARPRIEGSGMHRHRRDRRTAAGLRGRAALSLPELPGGSAGVAGVVLPLSPVRCLEARGDRAPPGPAGGVGNRGRRPRGGPPRGRLRRGRGLASRLLALNIALAAEEGTVLPDEP